LVALGGRANLRTLQLVRTWDIPPSHSGEPIVDDVECFQSEVILLDRVHLGHGHDPRRGGSVSPTALDPLEYATV
jgi:hypothetical protein